MSFAELDLSPALLRALTERNYSAPTPIQSIAIPEILRGRDILASYCRDVCTAGQDYRHYGSNRDSH